MFSNRVSSVFFSSVIALLLGACLLLPNNGFAAVLGDVNCDEVFNIQDIVLNVGWLLGTAERVDCDPPCPFGYMMHPVYLECWPAYMYDEACGEGELFNPASGMCVTPTTCTSPALLNTATNACVTPTTCTSPALLNTATNACVTPAAPEPTINCFQSGFCAYGADYLSTGLPNSKDGPATINDCLGWGPLSWPEQNSVATADMWYRGREAGSGYSIALQFSTLVIDMTAVCE